MNLLPAPEIDSRSAEDFFGEVTDRLARDLDWSAADPLAEALVRIFARYSEIVIDRLNRVPAKNFLTYLDLLGVTPVEPTSAIVPLTFVPASVVGNVRVPARTQVAAAPAKGKTEPIVFETERALELTTATLKQIFFLDPVADTETELGMLADAVLADDTRVWEAPRASDHVLYLAHNEFFGLAQNARVVVKFEIENSFPNSGEKSKIAWEIYTSKAKISLTPVVDTTQGLTQTGELVFEKIPTWTPDNFRGVTSRWLSGRLTSGLPLVQAGGRRVKKIEMIVQVQHQGVLDAVYSSGSQVDFTQDYFPFGPRPVFGATLYIASREAFSRPGTSVTLDLKLTNPHDAVEPPPLPPVFVEGHPRVAWEYWNGLTWSNLVQTDSTKYFRVDGVVGFRIPADVAPSVWNSVENFWIRARLTSGHYGQDARVELINTLDPAAGVRAVPSTLSAPSIQSMTVRYQLEMSAKAPDAAITSNSRVFEDVTACAQSHSGFRLFWFPTGVAPALYLCFAGRDKSSFVSRSLNLYFHLAALDHAVNLGAARSELESFRCQYWNGPEWRTIEAIEASGIFTEGALLSFIVPADLAGRYDLGTYSDQRTPSPEESFFWFRIVTEPAARSSIRRLRGILRNTVLATHTVTLEKEILGSSDRSPHQRFIASSTPILKQVTLQVREAESTSEVQRLMADLPASDLEIVSDELGRAHEAWVKWREVPDLLSSGPDHRHYTVDRQSGEIRFGDGLRARIPSRGNRIRLLSYQTGGGAEANVAAGRITELRNAIPYVDSARNLVPARGGSDLEDVNATCERGATLVRHRNRAVTCEDYEDLARLASPDVALAKCVPHRDLALDPDGVRYSLGTITLIIAPRSDAARPRPGSLLLQQIRSYLDGHRDVSAQLILIGPEFVEVSVEVEAVLDQTEEAGLVVASIDETLNKFLHPLYGGRSQRGWSFGELPNRSKLYSLCVSVPGVHHLRVFHMETIPERDGGLQAGNFLICSGKHTIAVSHETVVPSA